MHLAASTTGTSWSKGTLARGVRRRREHIHYHDAYVHFSLSLYIYIYIIHIIYQTITSSSLGLPWADNVRQALAAAEALDDALVVLFAESKGPETHDVVPFAAAGGHRDGRLRLHRYLADQRKGTNHQPLLEPICAHN